MTDRPSPSYGMATAARETDITGSIYLTRPEAALYLNVHSRWLANNAKTGPRYIKLGGLVRYSVEALDAFMSAHEGRH